MRKSILLLVIVGAFVAGSVLTPQYAEADHDADFAELATIVGILFNGINDGFATLTALIVDIQVYVDANTQKSTDNMMDITDNANAITAIGPHTVDTNAGTICATGELLDGDGNCIPIPADGISPLTSIRVTTTEPEFLLPTDETVIGVAPTSHIFLPLGIPDGKIIVIKNAGCGCILSAQEDDEILNGDIILGFTDAVVLQYLNGIWFEIAEYAGLPAPP